MTNNINSKRIPVKVLDTKTGISSEYVSIAEAARFFRIYPKAIWRKVQSKELYKGRYYIIGVYSYKAPMTKFSLMAKYKKVLYNRLFTITYLIKKNLMVIFYILLLLIILVISIYDYIFHLILVGIDTYNAHFPKFKEMDIDTLYYILQNESHFYRDKIDLLVDNPLAEFNKKWKSEYLSSSIKDNIELVNAKVNYYQYLINQKNWLINSFFTPSIHSIPSSISPPNPSLFVNSTIVINESPPSSAYFIHQDIIEQASGNANSGIASKEALSENLSRRSSTVFNKRISNDSVNSTTLFNRITPPSIKISSFDTENIRGVETHNLYNNYRYYSVIDKALYGPKSPGRRLLNYESNILFCLINGLSSPNLPKA